MKPERAKCQHMQLVVRLYTCQNHSVRQARRTHSSTGQIGPKCITLKKTVLSDIGSLAADV